MISIMTRGAARGSVLLLALGAATACRDLVMDSERNRINAAIAPGTACVPPPAGLISWWSGDLDGRDQMERNDGTLFGGVGAGIPAAVGGGFDFDGVDDFVEAPDSPSLNITGSLTLMAWVNVALTGDAIISKGNLGGSGDESYALVVYDDMQPAFWLNSGRYPGRIDLSRLMIGSGAYRLHPGEWHHLAGTFDFTSGKVVLYVDGLLRGYLLNWSDVQVVGGLMATNQPVRIGKNELGGSPYPTTYFRGRIDEAQIYDRALGEEEVLTIYNAGSAGLCRSGPPPSPTADAGGPYAGPEGSEIGFDGSGSANPGGGGLSYAWDFGDGSSSTGATPQHAYADNGNYVVTLTVTNGLGASTTARATAEIANVAPSVGPVSAPLEPQLIGATISAQAPFTDPGSLDTHSARFDWDAAGTSARSEGTASGGLAEATHQYSSPGVYTVSVVITDDDGASGDAEFQYIVVYDPSAGFVTGGGQIESPAGAFRADPALTGKATFAFVSRYKNGATIPSGDTQFRFKAAGLEFSSTEYEWLVVAGPRAQYKGSGRISGAGDYGFMLIAIDGGLPGGGGGDRFRIKIWDRGTGAIVYDNELGAGDNADPTTAILSGAIVIHR